jgi:hypothetical protein
LAGDSIQHNLLVASPSQEEIMNSVERKGDAGLNSIANTGLEHQTADDPMQNAHNLGSMREKEDSSTSPVDRLPPEILHQFLQYLREFKIQESDTEDEVKLAQRVLKLRSVCKYSGWRSVIDGGGKGIWTACAFRTHGEGPPHEERVQQWILRAGNHPLQTVLHMYLGRSLETFLADTLGAGLPPYFEYPYRGPAIRMFWRQCRSRTGSL